MSITDKIRSIRENVRTHGPLLVDEEETHTRSGVKYSEEELLDSLIEFYNAHGRWPQNTTEYRDDSSLPHSATVKRHFGSLEEAQKRARGRMQKD